MLENAARLAWGYAALVITDDTLSPSEYLVVKSPSQAPEGSRFELVIGEEHAAFADAQWVEFQRENDI
jgi:hypothetical protein